MRMARLQRGRPSFVMPLDPSHSERATPSQRWWRAHQVLRDSLVKFYRADSLMVSASIAYYSVLALFPLLLLLLGLSAIYIRRYELSGRLAVVLQHYLPFKTDFLMQNFVVISRAY